ncbi:LPXTG cell wall anchor domain-containing protein [Streptococcus suis]|nr:LPXTG cell wall anchor domain-containing protein [Streptococcus suis]
MNKKLIVSSLLVPLVASTGVVVQAEQVDTTNVPETVVENSAQSTDAATLPTKEEVEQAKSELNAANTAVATQEAVVDSVQASTKAMTTQKTSQPVTKTLPSTGDTFSLMSLIGVGLLGLAPVARKRK